MKRRFSIRTLLLLTIFVAIGCAIWPSVYDHFGISVPGGSPQYYLDDDIQYFPAATPSNLGEKQLKVENP
jgi:hypothetical protein